MDTLSGTVERVTFHTEETGFSVLKVKVKGRSEPVTVTGRTPAVHAGEVIEATGEWVTVPEYGRQFRAETITISAPSTREGIERYLASGLIEGIGPVYAKKLVEKFGEEVFDVIENHSARLREVPGVGVKRRKEIKESWERQKSVREIMLFLHRHGVGTAKAVKIFKTYGEAAVETLTQNPYRLARDVHGIGFKSADVIARRIGLAADSEERLRAGLFHVLLEAAGDGHCALPREELIAKAVELLQMPDASLVERALDAAVENAEVARETIDSADLIFPPHLARAEREIAKRLKTLAALPGRLETGNLDEALAKARKESGRELAESQERAVRMALSHRVLVVTGGPGVGKTTILQTILRVLDPKRGKCVLAAPTGRAARRMAESTGHEAKTIHRLLEVEPGGRGFKFNAKNPLKGDLFVLDEASMVDTALMAHWLRAVPETGHVLLVGDVDQLPSVGPGAVLADIIRGGVVPVVRLTEIFRQAAASRIITAAHAINQGRLPDLPKPPPPGCDFYFIERETPEAALETILRLAKERVPRAFGLDPVNDVQVLCPMNRGLLGTANLNVELQRALNPPMETRQEVERFGITFREGDKVIQTRNNYEKEVFNGDIGRVIGMAADPLRVYVRFEDGREAVYESGDLDELRPAWAITIHKSQGSEFPAVVIPVSTQHYVMLQRNLLYTGVTRGRRLVVLVGDRKALGLAVRNADGRKRWTGLWARLRGPETVEI